MFNSLAEMVIFSTTENSDVLSANNFAEYNVERNLYQCV